MIMAFFKIKKVIETNITKSPYDIKSLTLSCWRDVFYCLGMLSSDP